MQLVWLFAVLTVLGLGRAHPIVKREVPQGMYGHPVSSLKAR